MTEIENKTPVDPLFKFIQYDELRKQYSEFSDAKILNMLHAQGVAINELDLINRPAFVPSTVSLGEAAKSADTEAGTPVPAAEPIKADEPDDSANQALTTAEAAVFLDLDPEKFREWFLPSIRAKAERRAGYIPPDDTMPMPKRIESENPSAMWSRESLEVTKAWMDSQ